MRKSVKKTQKVIKTTYHNNKEFRFNLIFYSYIYI